MSGFLHTECQEEVRRKEALYREQHELWFAAPDAPQEDAKTCHEKWEARTSRELKFQLQSLGKRGHRVPTLLCTTRIGWLHLPAQAILGQLGTLQEGICRGVFRQRLQRHGLTPSPKAAGNGHSPGSGDVASWRKQ